jgi:hypothetical protein
MSADGFLTRERFEELFADEGYGDYVFEFDRHGSLNSSGKDFAGSPVESNYEFDYNLACDQKLTCLQVVQLTKRTRTYVNGTYDHHSNRPSRSCVVNYNCR